MFPPPAYFPLPRNCTFIIQINSTICFMQMTLLQPVECNLRSSTHVAIANSNR